MEVKKFWGRTMIVIVNLIIVLGLVSGCSNQRKIKEEKVHDYKEKEEEEKDSIKVINGKEAFKDELFEETDGQEMLEESNSKESVKDEEIQYNIRDTTNYQPYKEYVDNFPKYIEPQYMPKCHSYFIGNPYKDGNIVYKLTISTGCIGEYCIKVRLEKLKVEKSVSEGNYVGTEKTEEGETRDIFETKENIRYDNSVCPNVAVAYDTEFNEPEELHYIDCYMVTGVGENGNFNNGYDVPIIDQIIYNPGTTIENYRTFYSFEDFYGYEKYIHMDTSKVNSEDVIIVDTNIEPFASEISGKAFKADWDMDVGMVDELADPLQLQDVVNGYDYGYEYNDTYSKPVFYETLLY